jgi:hypothetical protein
VQARCPIAGGCGRPHEGIEATAAAAVHLFFRKLCWNGGYYEQRLEDPDAFPYQFGKGCHSDQLLGQFLAHVTGLGHLLPAEHVRDPLCAVSRNNFARRMEDVATMQRVYALNDESALVLCTWPRGGRPRFPFGYSDEVWTGVEYQVASSLIYEGLLDEALVLVDAVRSRHDGYRRNPWSESEAGHHYARSLASYGLITAMLGFKVDLPRGVIRFDPKFTGRNFCCFWSHGKGWGGGFKGSDKKGEATAEVLVIEGTLGATRIEAPVPVSVISRRLGDEREGRPGPCPS